MSQNPEKHIFMRTFCAFLAVVFFLTTTAQSAPVYGFKDSANAPYLETLDPKGSSNLLDSVLGALNTPSLDFLALRKNGLPELFDRSLTFSVANALGVKDSQKKKKALLDIRQRLITSPISRKSPAVRDAVDLIFAELMRADVFNRYSTEKAARNISEYRYRTVNRGRSGSVKLHKAASLGDEKLTREELEEINLVIANKIGSAVSFSSKSLMKYLAKYGTRQQNEALRILEEIKSRLSENISAKVLYEFFCCLEHTIRTMDFECFSRFLRYTAELAPFIKGPRHSASVGTNLQVLVDSLRDEKLEKLALDSIREASESGQDLRAVLLSTGKFLRSLDINEEIRNKLRYIFLWFGKKPNTDRFVVNSFCLTHVIKYVQSPELIPSYLDAFHEFFVSLESVFGVLTVTVENGVQFSRQTRDVQILWIVLAKLLPPALRFQSTPEEFRKNLNSLRDLFLLKELSEVKKLYLANVYLPELIEFLDTDFSTDLAALLEVLIYLFRENAGLEDLFKEKAEYKKIIEKDKRQEAVQEEIREKLNGLLSYADVPTEFIKILVYLSSVREIIETEEDESDSFQFNAYLEETIKQALIVILKGFFGIVEEIRARAKSGYMPGPFSYEEVPREVRWSFSTVIPHRKIVRTRRDMTKDMDLPVFSSDDSEDKRIRRNTLNLLIKHARDGISAEKSGRIISSYLLEFENMDLGKIGLNEKRILDLARKSREFFDKRSEGSSLGRKGRERKKHRMRRQTKFKTGRDGGRKRPSLNDLGTSIGVQEMLQTNPRQALRILTKQLRKSPRNAVLWTQKAMALKELKRFDEALSAAKKAIRFDPQNVQSYMLAAWTYSKLDELEEALSMVEEAEAIRGNDSESHALEAQILRDLGRFDEALNAINVAMQLKLGDSRAYLTKAQILRTYGRYEEALAVLDLAGHLGADSIHVWNAGAQILKDMGKYDKALEQAEETLRHEPSEARNYVVKIQILKDMGRTNEALRVVNEALEHDNLNLQCHGLKAQILKDMAKYDEALETMEAALSIRPNNIQANVIKVQILGDMGSMEEALALLRQIKKGRPKDSQILLLEAQLVKETGDIEKSIKLLNEAKNMCPGYIKTYILLAQFLRDAGKNEKAMEVVNEAYEIDGKNIYLLRIHAQLLRDIGKSRESLEVINAVLSLSPQDFRSLLIKAMLLRDLKEYGEALEAVDLALNLRPDKAISYGVKTRILREARRFEKALEVIEEGVSLSPENIMCNVNKALVLYEMGKKEDAQETAKFVAKLVREKKYLPNDMGFVTGMLVLLESLTYLDNSAKGIYAALREKAEVNGIDSARSILEKLGAKRERFEHPPRSENWAVKDASERKELIHLLKGDLKAASCSFCTDGRNDWKASSEFIEFFLTRLRSREVSHRAPIFRALEFLKNHWDWIVPLKNRKPNKGHRSSYSIPKKNKKLILSETRGHVNGLLPEENAFLLSIVDATVAAAASSLGETMQALLAELEGLGYDVDEEELLRQVNERRIADGTFGFTKLDNDPVQLKLLKEDLGVFIEKRHKFEPGNKEINIFQFGLGRDLKETKQFIDALYWVLQETLHVAESWQINFYGFDINSTCIEAAREKIKSLFYAETHPGLNLKFETADILNPASLKSALVRSGADGKKADYILQRYVTHPNWRAEQGFLTESLRREPGMSRNFLPAHVINVLRAFLAYKNLLIFLGRAQDESGDLATRFVVEPNKGSGMTFLPPGTELAAPRNMGILKLADLGKVLNAGLAGFQKAVRFSVKVQAENPIPHETHELIDRLWRALSDEDEEAFNETFDELSDGHGVSMIRFVSGTFFTEGWDQFLSDFLVFLRQFEKEAEEVEPARAGEFVQKTISRLRDFQRGLREINTDENFRELTKLLERRVEGELYRLNCPEEKHEEFKAIGMSSINEMLLGIKDSMEAFGEEIERISGIFKSYESENNEDFIFFGRLGLEKIRLMIHAGKEECSVFRHKWIDMHHLEELFARPPYDAAAHLVGNLYQHVTRNGGEGVLLLFTSVRDESKYTLVCLDNGKGIDDIAGNFSGFSHSSDGHHHRGLRIVADDHPVVEVVSKGRVGRKKEGIFQVASDEKYNGVRGTKIVIGSSLGGKRKTETRKVKVTFPDSGKESFGDVLARKFIGGLFKFLADNRIRIDAEIKLQKKQEERRGKSLGSDEADEKITDSFEATKEGIIKMFEAVDSIAVFASGREYRMILERYFSSDDPVENHALQALYNSFHNKFGPLLSEFRRFLGNILDNSNDKLPDAAEIEYLRYLTDVLHEYFDVFAGERQNFSFAGLRISFLGEIERSIKSLFDRGFGRINLRLNQRALDVESFRENYLEDAYSARKDTKEALARVFNLFEKALEIFESDLLSRSSLTTLDSDRTPVAPMQRKDLPTEDDNGKSLGSAIEKEMEALIASMTSSRILTTKIRALKSLRAFAAEHPEILRKRYVSEVRVLTFSKEPDIKKAALEVLKVFRKKRPDLFAGDIEAQSLGKRLAERQAWRNIDELWENYDHFLNFFLDHPESALLFILGRYFDAENPEEMQVAKVLEEAFRDVFINRFSSFELIEVCENQKHLPTEEIISMWEETCADGKRILRIFAGKAAGTLEQQGFSLMGRISCALDTILKTSDLDVTLDDFKNKYSAVIMQASASVCEALYPRIEAIEARLRAVTSAINSVKKERAREMSSGSELKLEVGHEDSGTVKKESGRQPNMRLAAKFLRERHLLGRYFAVLKKLSVPAESDSRTGRIFPTNEIYLHNANSSVRKRTAELKRKYPGTELVNVGVSLDQNFGLLSVTNAERAFFLDVDPINSLVLLPFLGLVMGRCQTRAEFLSALQAKELPYLEEKRRKLLDRLSNASYRDVQDILNELEHVSLEDHLDFLEKLSSQIAVFLGSESMGTFRMDKDKIYDYLKESFPWVKDSRRRGWFEAYAAHTWLKNDKAYRRARRKWEEGKIFGVIGSVWGEGIERVAREIERDGSKLNVLYLSNVKRPSWPEKKWKEFAENVFSDEQLKTARVLALAGNCLFVNIPELGDMTDLSALADPVIFPLKDYLRRNPMNGVSIKDSSADEKNEDENAYSLGENADSDVHKTKKGFVIPPGKSFKFSGDKEALIYLPHGESKPKEEHEDALLTSKWFIYVNEAKVALVRPLWIGEKLVFRQEDLVAFDPSDLSFNEQSYLMQSGRSVKNALSRGRLEEEKRRRKLDELKEIVPLNILLGERRGGIGRTFFVNTEISEDLPRTEAVRDVLNISRDKPASDVAGSKTVKRFYVKVTQDFMRELVKRRERFRMIAKNAPIVRNMAVTRELVKKEEFEEFGIEGIYGSEVFVQEPVIVLSDIIKELVTEGTDESYALAKMLIMAFVNRLEELWRCGIVDMDSRFGNWGINRNGKLVFHDFDFTMSNKNGLGEGEFQAEFRRITEADILDPVRKEDYKRFKERVVGTFVHLLAGNYAELYQLFGDVEGLEAEGPKLADFFLRHIRKKVKFIDEIMIDSEKSDRLAIKVAFEKIRRTLAKDKKHTRKWKATAPLRVLFSPALKRLCPEWLESSQRAAEKAQERIKSVEELTREGGDMLEVLTEEETNDFRLLMKYGKNFNDPEIGRRLYRFFNDAVVKRKDKLSDDFRSLAPDTKFRRFDSKEIKRLKDIWRRKYEEPYEEFEKKKTFYEEQKNVRGPRYLLGVDLRAAERYMDIVDEVDTPGNLSSLMHVLAGKGVPDFQLRLTEAAHLKQLHLVVLKDSGDIRLVNVPRSDIAQDITAEDRQAKQQDIFCYVIGENGTLPIQIEADIEEKDETGQSTAVRSIQLSVGGPKTPVDVETRQPLKAISTAFSLKSKPDAETEDDGLEEEIIDKIPERAYFVRKSLPEKQRGGRIDALEESGEDSGVSGDPSAAFNEFVKKLPWNENRKKRALSNSERKELEPLKQEAREKGYWLLLDIGLNALMRSGSQIKSSLEDAVSKLPELSSLKAKKELPVIWVDTKGVRIVKKKLADPENNVYIGGFSFEKGMWRKYYVKKILEGSRVWWAPVTKVRKPDGTFEWKRENEGEVKSRNASSLGDIGGRNAHNQIRKHATLILKEYERGDFAVFTSLLDKHGFTREDADNLWGELNTLDFWLLHEKIKDKSPSETVEDNDSRVEIYSDNRLVLKRFVDEDAFHFFRKVLSRAGKILVPSVMDSGVVVQPLVSTFVNKQMFGSTAHFVLNTHPADIRDMVRAICYLWSVGLDSWDAFFVVNYGKFPHERHFSIFDAGSEIKTEDEFLQREDAAAEWHIRYIIPLWPFLTRYVLPELTWNKRNELWRTKLQKARRVVFPARDNMNAERLRLIEHRLNENRASSLGRWPRWQSTELKGIMPSVSRQVLMMFEGFLREWQTLFTDYASPALKSRYKQRLGRAQKCAERYRRLYIDNVKVFKSTTVEKNLNGCIKSTFGMDRHISNGFKFLEELLKERIEGIKRQTPLGKRATKMHSNAFMLRGFIRALKKISGFSSKAESFDLEEAVKDILYFIYWEKANNSGVSISVDSKSFPANVIFPKRYLLPLFASLFRKASAANTKKKKINVSWRIDESGENLQALFRYNGMDFSENDADKIFDNKLLSRKDLRRGRLSLEKLRKMVRAAGGDISVEVRDGKTIFIISVPLEEKADFIPSTEASVASEERTRTRVRVEKKNEKTAEESKERDFDEDVLKLLDHEFRHAVMSIALKINQLIQIAEERNLEEISRKLRTYRKLFSSRWTGNLFQLRQFCDSVEKNIQGLESMRYGMQALVSSEGASNLILDMEDDIRCARQISEIIRRAPKEKMGVGRVDFGAMLDSLQVIAARHVENIAELNIEKPALALVIEFVNVALLPIFSDLVRNALREFVLAGTPSPRIEIETKVVPSEKKVVVSVSDNGPGISPQIEADLFVEGKTTKNPRRGGGVGLAAAKRMIERCGGRITAQSKGKLGGATFRLEFLLAEAQSLGTKSEMGILSLRSRKAEAISNEKDEKGVTPVFSDESKKKIGVTLFSAEVTGNDNIRILANSALIGLEIAAKRARQEKKRERGRQLEEKTLRLSRRQEVSFMFEALKKRRGSFIAVNNAA